MEHFSCIQYKELIIVVFFPTTHGTHCTSPSKWNHSECNICNNSLFLFIFSWFQPFLDFFINLMFEISVADTCIFFFKLLSPKSSKMIWTWISSSSSHKNAIVWIFLQTLSYFFSSIFFLLYHKGFSFLP